VTESSEAGLGDCRDEALLEVIFGRVVQLVSGHSVGVDAVDFCDLGGCGAGIVWFFAWMERDLKNSCAWHGEVCCFWDAECQVAKVAASSVGLDGACIGVDLCVDGEETGIRGCTKNGRENRVRECVRGSVAAGRHGGFWCCWLKGSIVRVAQCVVLVASSRRVVASVLLRWWILVRLVLLDAFGVLLLLIACYL
jgi:hypothetical protein